MNNRGFTLVELLLSIAIMTILTGLSLPVYESFARRNDLDLMTQNVASALRRAEVYARGVKNDSAWGVQLQASSVTLFKGSAYNTRDTAFDETLELPASINLSGDTEVVFSKLTGVPDVATTISLSSTTNDTRTITVNAKGMVAY